MALLIKQVGTERVMKVKSMRTKSGFEYCVQTVNDDGIGGLYIDTWFQTPSMHIALTKIGV